MSDNIVLHKGLEIRYVFLERNSIRVDASNSNSGRFDRSPNTGHEFAEYVERQVANRQVSHYSAGWPHALFPVIRS